MAGPLDPTIPSTWGTARGPQKPPCKQVQGMSRSLPYNNHPLLCVLGTCIPTVASGVRFPRLTGAPFSRRSGRGFLASPAQVFAPHLTLPSRRRCLDVSGVWAAPFQAAFPRDRGLGMWGESELPGPLGIRGLWYSCLPGHTPYRQHPHLGNCNSCGCGPGHLRGQSTVACGQPGLSPGN